MQKHKAGLYEKYIKRLFDIIGGLLVLILFCWLYGIIAILVKVKLGSPVLFKQDRPGKIDAKTGQEQVFSMYKFRTMTDGRDENGELLPDNLRLTGFGRFLRSTSLDELPEIFCIINGTMSVVGPRPLLVDYLPLYSERQRIRHCVRPGLTGWAQVNGRNAITWKEKFEYDIEYVEKISFSMDLKILFKTISTTLKREGINSSEDVTMERFTGNN